jgi:ABC-type sugar transport system ATPase subunit
VAVIFISHNIQQVLRVVDRVIVLRLGHKIFDGDRANMTGPQLVGLMTGAINEDALAGIGPGATSEPKPRDKANEI